MSKLSSDPLLRLRETKNPLSCRHSTKDAFPLFVSCYVCHYNLPLAANEFQRPSKKRVHYWLRSTTVAASVFYMTVGLAGSAYRHCTPTGKVQGNVLLDFDEDDPLLLVARMCLACTITLAFPLLVIPARDILLRSWFTTATENSGTSTMEQTTRDGNPGTITAMDEGNTLQEPLLANNDLANQDGDAEEGTAINQTTEGPTQHSFLGRLGFAILVLWSAAAVASCVKSIDIVWDLLGSSLSILLSYLIPCACFISIVGSSTENENGNEEADNDRGNQAGRNMPILVARGMIAIYVPLMVISTANAFIATFLHHPGTVEETEVIL